MSRSGVAAFVGLLACLGVVLGLVGCSDDGPNPDFQKACNAAARGQGYLEYSTDGQTHCYAIVQGTGWKFLY